MKSAEITYPLRKYDDLYYTVERIVYGKGELSGFTTEDIYNSLRDNRLFNSPQDLDRFLLDNQKKFKIRRANDGWERYW
jgi:hypothetical protein